LRARCSAQTKMSKTTPCKVAWCRWRSGENILTRRANHRQSRALSLPFEFKRLSRLNENIGKADQEIWEMVA
jgi:hypothetical protein